MTLSDYRNTHAWKAALDLGPHLVRVAEQLPDDEFSGMNAELRRLSVEVAAAVAAQLLTDTEVALVVVIRAVAALEIIERVYPALDTAAARAAADKLAERVATGITETIPAPASDSDDEDSDSEGHASASLAPAGPAAAPDVSGSADPSTEPPILAAPAPTSTTIPVTGDHVVYPDSPQ